MLPVLFICHAQPCEQRVLDLHFAGHDGRRSGVIDGRIRATMSSLFDPIRLGAVHAPNRIVMAPLTRARGTREHVATPIMAKYYAQRASAGLIISEAIGISREGLGWPYATGLWTPAQIEAWKPVTAAVHAAGGRMAAQLWHMGRVVHSSVGGAQPVSASDTTAPGDAHTYEGKQPHVPARALRLDEIPRVVADYAAAARAALSAGFDMIELHAANGYLIDQFLRDSSNLRTDAYGGPPENRIRLLSEVTQALVQVAGAERTAVRMSPDGMAQGVEDSQPERVYALAAAALSKLGIAFVELRERGPAGTNSPTTAVIRSAFKGPLIVNSGYGLETGNAALAAGHADAVAFGKSFLANPDLPHRFAEKLALNSDDMHTWYTQGEVGYVDYPAVTLV